jgi:hypothetical protein
MLPSQPWLPGVNFDGLVWEWHNDTGNFPNLSIDTSPGVPTWLVSRPDGVVPSVGAITPGHWYQVVFVIKWSTGSDGYMKVSIDGTQVVNYTGFTITAAEGQPYVQFGWYSDIGTPPIGTSLSQLGGITREILP